MGNLDLLCEKQFCVNKLRLTRTKKRASEDKRAGFVCECPIRRPQRPYVNSLRAAGGDERGFRSHRAFIFRRIKSLPLHGSHFHIVQEVRGAHKNSLLSNHSPFTSSFLSAWMETSYLRTSGRQEACSLRPPLPKPVWLL